jgi:hypothetical protein
MFELVFCQKPAKHSQKQHKKLPEIFFPFFGVVGVVVDFHSIAINFILNSKHKKWSYRSFKILIPDKTITV